MGWLIVLFGIVVVSAILFWKTKNKELKYVSLFTFLYSCTAFTVVTFYTIGPSQVGKFKLEYKLYSQIDVSTLDTKEKAMIYKKIEKINHEILYAKENHDSFWYGWFTSSEFTKYELINK